MRFVLDDEQRMLAETLHRLLSDADTPGAARAWARGDHAPGRDLWTALASTGVFALAVPEEHGGAGAHPVELVTAMVELGRHAVPGPVVETVAAARMAGGAAWLAGIADGSVLATAALPPTVPYALDADVADLLVVRDPPASGGDRAPNGGMGLAGGPPRTGRADAPLCSLDPTRRLFTWEPGPPLEPGPALDDGPDLAVLCCAAQSLGLGRALLEATVAHAGTRHQFGRPIGAFQAVQHRLADTLTALEFAQPLVHGAALAHGTPDFARDVSAAKVAAAEAAHTAARTALQVHGAIGYTDEHDLSWWIRKARALRSAWGTPADHRARVVAALTAPPPPR